MGVAVAPEKLTPPQLAASDRLVRSSVYIKTEAAGQGKVAPNGEAYDVRIIASTGRVARDRGIILPSAWVKDLSRFLANPVILWCHSYDQPPVATCVDLALDAAGNMTQYWRFLTGLSEDSYDALANRLKVLYQAKGLNAASVGFIIHEFRDPTPEEKIEGLQKDRIEPMWVAERAELLETSAVPVPADANALAVDRAIQDGERHGADMAPVKAAWERAKKNPPPSLPVAAAAAAAAPVVPAPASAPAAAAAEPTGERAAIGYGAAHPEKNYSVAAKGVAWDAGAEVKKMPAAKAALRLRHAWVNSDGDPDTKGSYKFPHHRGGSGAAVVFKACAAGFARLGSAKIPAGDKDGVASHLGKHYKTDFDTDPPERAALELACQEFPAGERGAALWTWAAKHSVVLLALGGGDGQLALELIQAAREATTVACPECQADVPAGEAACPYCGAAMPHPADPDEDEDDDEEEDDDTPQAHAADAAQVTCPHCGKKVTPKDDGTCPECGKPVEDVPDDEEDASATPEQLRALEARLATLEEGAQEAQVDRWLAAGAAALEPPASPEIAELTHHVEAVLERLATPMIEAALQRHFGILPAPRAAAVH